MASGTSQRAVPFAMSAVVLLVVAMQAAVNLAVPKLALGHLHPSPSGLLWIVDAYIVVFASLLIAGGAAGDRYGRRGALLAGVMLFTVGCTVCAVAPSMPVMLAGRVVTGLGAALAMPNSLAVVIAVTSPARRPRAIGLWASTTAAAGLIGNVAAGLTLAIGSPSLLFALFAVLGLACCVVTKLVTPPIESHDHRQDPVGSLLLVGGLVALTSAIIEVPTHGWRSGVVIGAAACAAVALALFVAWERRREQPLLDPRVLALPGIRLGLPLISLVFVGMFGFFYLNAQYLQLAKGYGPAVTGVAIAPVAVTMFVAGRLAHPLSARIGSRATVCLGFVLIGAGLLGFSTDTAHTGYLTYLAPLLVMGLGLGGATPVLTTENVSALGPRLAGVAAGLNGAARAVGSSLGIAIAGTILAGRFTDRLPDVLHGQGRPTPAAVLSGLASGSPTRDAAMSAFTAATADAIRTVAVASLAGALLTMVSAAHRRLRPAVR